MIGTFLPLGMRPRKMGGAKWGRRTSERDTVEREEGLNQVRRNSSPSRLARVISKCGFLKASSQQASPGIPVSPPPPTHTHQA